MNLLIFFSVLSAILGSNYCESIISNNIGNGTAALHKVIEKEVLDYVRVNIPGFDITPYLADETISADIDEFVDKVVVSIRDFIGTKGYDHILLPDESNIKIKPVGKLNLLEGSLSGLTSMQRFEHATLLYDRTSKRVRFDMILRFTEIDFIYKYHSKVLFIQSTGHLHGKIEKLKIRVKLGFDFEKYQAFVEDVDVNETGTIDIWLSGNSGIDWFTNSVITVITSILHPVILKAVTNALRDPVNTIVQAVNEIIKKALHPSNL